jgi:hypothetical protein
VLVASRGKVAGGVVTEAATGAVSTLPHLPQVTPGDPSMDVALARLTCTRVAAAGGDGHRLDGQTDRQNLQPPLVAFLGVAAVFCVWPGWGGHRGPRALTEPASCVNVCGSPAETGLGPRQAKPG